MRIYKSPLIKPMVKLRTISQDGPLEEISPAPGNICIVCGGGRPHCILEDDDDDM